MAGSALSELISAVSYLSSSGYAPAGGGNASLRKVDNLLVTQTGVSLERLSEEDLCPTPRACFRQKHPDAVKRLKSGLSTRLPHLPALK
jgi:ribulose-5-phosphate 4-epimerase/fuculose-1-phosphate aldolase